MIREQEVLQIIIRKGSYQASSPEKKDGTKRMILNLKKLNSFIKYEHFKMESIHNVLEIITPHAYMASIDLKDAFYSISVTPEHRKYLKFKFLNNTYQFNVMPFGYGPAMRIFTKTMKAVFRHLRQKGHKSVIYVDDFYLQGNSYTECLKNIENTIHML